MTRAPGTAEAPFESSTFLGRPGGTAAFAEAVLARLSSRPAQRILDLGCGAGDLAIALKRKRPDLDIVGIDISPHNVALARQRAHATCGSSSPSFVHADYLSFADGSFNAILADSVLHLIPVADDVLGGKLSRDLQAGGLLIATLPIRSAGNSALMLQRRIWRQLPGIVDGPLLRLARLMHRAEAPEMLADRIQYLRLLPSRFLDESFSSALTRHGFQLALIEPWPSSSLFKPKHRIATYRCSAIRR